MNPLARSSIRELASGGVRLDPVEDLHHIARILELADRALRVQKELNTLALLRPARAVGNIVLRRLSIGAQNFLQDEVGEWFEEDSEDAVLSWAFCYAHAADPAEIWTHQGDRAGWKARLRAWKKTLDVSIVELIAAINDFQLTDEETAEALRDALEAGKAGKRRVDDEDTVAKGSGTLGPVLDRLIAEYGKDAEAWIWRTPAEEVELLIDAFLERDEADRIRNAPKGKGVARDPDGVFRRTFRRLRLYMEEIRKEKAAQCQKS